MNPLDDLPQRDSAHDTAEAAENAFRTAIEDYKLFLIQRDDRHDYGSDFELEARTGSAMTNIRVHVQLKGTGSPLRGNSSIAVSVARSNLNYLLVQPDSLYVCFHLPSQRLFVCYVEDVYRDYEHRDEDWAQQDNVTVTFVQDFDEGFQRQLNARLLERGRSSRDRRLQWIAAPPERIPLLAKHNVVIEVPADPVRAKEILDALYADGDDAEISRSFARFEAVLGTVPGAMGTAYLAEINLEINGSSFDRDRVTQAIAVLEARMNSGEVHPGSVLYLPRQRLAGFASIRKGTRLVPKGPETVAPATQSRCSVQEELGFCS